MMPSRTRSQLKYTTASNIEKLPAEILTKILEFSELPERLQLARCSKTLQHTITKDSAPLWIKISFSFENEELQKRVSNLGDEMLCKLLKRVNAHSVTKELSLYSCSGLRDGKQCLVPLRHSRVLERVDLRFEGDPHVINTFESGALQVLRTCIPHKLFQVNFESYSYMKDRDRFATLTLSWSKLFSERGIFHRRSGFLRELRTEKQRQAMEQRITCDCCDDNVCCQSLQTVPMRTGPPSSLCVKCGEHFCRKASCPVGMTSCHYCSDAACKDCNIVGRCSDCDTATCNLCMPTFPCFDCKETFCLDCKGVDVCEACGKVFCDDCRDGQQGCSSCTNWYCDDCCDLRSCQECGEHQFCNECVRMKVVTCDCCDDFVCFGCLPVAECGMCNQVVCSFDTCISCDRKLCINCSKHRSCNDCHVPICNYCCPEGTHGNGLMRRCTACRKVYCKECSFDCCDSCQVAALCKHCSNGETLYRPTIHCIACNKKNDTTSHCPMCLEKRLSPSKVLSGVSHGICSSCLEEKQPPAKRLKRS